MGLVLKPCGCQQQESSSVPRSTCGKSARHSDFFGCSPFLRIRGKLQLCPAGPFRPPGSIDQPNPLRRNSTWKKLQPPRSSHVLVRLGNLYRLCRSEAGLPRSQRRSPGTEKESPGRPFGRRCGVFYNFHTGANVGLAVVEPCDPLWLGSPGQNRSTWPGLLPRRRKYSHACRSRWVPSACAWLRTYGANGN